WGGEVFIVDLADGGRRLLRIDTKSGRPASVGSDAISQLRNEFGAYIGMQATPVIGSVRLPDGTRERRLYVGVNSADQTLWCVNLDAVAADRAMLDSDSGDAYFCSSPAGATVWPRSLEPSSGNRTTGNLNGPPTFSADQPILDPKTGQTVVRDVLYAPSTGLECSNAEFWAIDAYTGEVFWTWDPVVVEGGGGGIIWTTPAMNRDRTMIYVTTGDCVTGPHMGELAESLVALDTATGEVIWHHQRRLVDAADMDIGNGPLVADVDGYGGCHVVVSSDKDGCIYGFPQERDLPEVGDPSYDPLRTGQQRLLYRKCFTPGSLNGGFNASNPAFHERWAMQQAAGYPAGHVGADDANAFALDVCNGRVAWASSSISNGRADAAVASGMLFQLGITRKTAGDYPYEFVREIQVVPVWNDTLAAPVALATVKLPAQGTLGGGGVAIAKGRIYVPTTEGIAVVAVVPGSNASPPIRRGNEIFAGPYPHPMSPALATLPPVDPDHPYPLLLDKEIERLQSYRD
ncbi:MAG: PQQ-binding-like beta-propeller repeat protein, partial [Candidatus Binatia bacterium]